MKILKALVSLLLLSVVNFSHAGIPTIDPAAIAQNIQLALQQASEAAAQLKALEQQIEEARNIDNRLKQQAKEELRRLEGNWGLSALFNDPTIASYLDVSDWTQALSDSKNLYSLRDKFNLTMTSKSAQERVDAILVSFDLIEQSYNASSKRAKNLQELSKLMDKATTPQMREDYANKISQEIAQNQLEKTRIDTMTEILKQQERIKKAQAAQEFSQKFRGR